MSQKFHGITLANNSTAENFHFERLAADPLPISAGRVWYNLTEKAFKYSSLDVNGGVTLNSFASATSMSESLLTLQNSLVTETTNRVAADAVISSNASSAVSTEAAARAAADTTLQDSIATVQSLISILETGSGLNVDGTFTAPTGTTYLGGATSLKNSTILLDTAVTNEVAARTAQEAAFNSSIATETQLRIAGDANLQTQLTAYIDSVVAGAAPGDGAESARAIAAEAAILSELDTTQATIGTAADGTLIPFTGTNYLNTTTSLVAAIKVIDVQAFNANTAIATEATARAANDTALNSSIQTEITNRTTADTAINTKISTIETGAGLENNGSYLAPVGSNYLNTATSLKSADLILDTAIKTISGQVTTLVDTTVPALQTQVTAEVTRSTAADVANATAIANEITRAQAAELALQTSINSINIPADSSSGLKLAINSGRFTYTAATGALEHVITHNLNTAYYIADIKVEGSDGVYRNDIVPVEEINSNSFRISLTEARKVKVSVMSMAALV